MRLLDTGNVTSAIIRPMNSLEISQFASNYATVANTVVALVSLAMSFFALQMTCESKKFCAG